MVPWLACFHRYVALFLFLYSDLIKLDVDRDYRMNYRVHEY